MRPRVMRETSSRSSTRRTSVVICRPQIAEQASSPLAEHLLRRLRDHGQDAAHSAGLDADRAVRPGEVALLKAAVARDRQESILGVRRFARRRNVREHRTDDVHNLGPHFGRRPTKRRRMLRAK